MPHGELDGWRYAYTDEGSGPPIVMLHGLQMDRSMWDAHVEALRERYRVVTIDAPGHGESAPVDVGIDFYRWGDMVLGVADQLGIHSAVWIGQSMGGFTILRMASRYPERMKGMVLIDTSPLKEDEDKLAQYEAFLQVALASGVNEDLVGLLLIVYFSQTFADKPESDVWRKKMLDTDVNADHAMIRAVFDRDDVEHLVPAMNIPAAVIHGVEDIAIEPEKGEKLASDLPDATFTLIEGAGHASPTERPDLVRPPIEAFLNRIAY
jgi:pimeloyl-ACP methyl ester carboxylesterase